MCPFMTLDMFETMESIGTEPTLEGLGLSLAVLPSTCMLHICD
jgi:hypothetical protein